jgi:hypothetical protein
VTWPMPCVPRRVGPSSAGHGRTQAWSGAALAAALCAAMYATRAAVSAALCLTWSSLYGHSVLGQEPWTWKYRQGILPDGSLSGVFTRSSLATEMLPSYTPGSQAVLTTAGAVGAADFGATGLVAEVVPLRFSVGMRVEVETICATEVFAQVVHTRG